MMKAVNGNCLAWERHSGVPPQLNNSPSSRILASLTHHILLRCIVNLVSMQCAPTLWGVTCTSQGWSSHYAGLAAGQGLWLGSCDPCLQALTSC